MGDLCLGLVVLLGAEVFFFFFSWPCFFQGGLGLEDATFFAASRGFPSFGRLRFIQIMHKSRYVHFIPFVKDS